MEGQNSLRNKIFILQLLMSIALGIIIYYLIEILWLLNSYFYEDPLAGSIVGLILFLGLFFSNVISIPLYLLYKFDDKFEIKGALRTVFDKIWTPFLLYIITITLTYVLNIW